MAKCVGGIKRADPQVRYNIVRFGRNELDTDWAYIATSTSCLIGIGLLEIRV